MMNHRKLTMLFVVFVLYLLMALGGVSAQDAVTLVVWDNWTRESEQAMIDTLNAEFEAANPGVTVQREAYDTPDLTETLPLALTESTGPDVAMVNQGFTGMGALVEAGLLLPLNAYADEYDWWGRYGMGLHMRNSFGDGGKAFGTGDLYGVSVTAEVVGVYYNKALFTEMGLEIPTSLDEFEAALKTIKDAGQTPIVFGSLDGWPAIHEYGAIQHAYSTAKALDDFIFRFADGTFDDEANLKAAQKFVEWIDAGYFSPGFEGMDYDNATLTAFVNGEGVFWITGSWMAGTLIDQMGEDAVGFFLFPDVAGSAAPLNIGGVGLAYGIRATSVNADLAAKYIDYITGARGAELLFDEGFLPASPVDPAKLTEGTLTADVVNTWTTISSNNAVGHYLDWTMPDIAADIQELMAKVVTPEQFIANVQEDYEAGM